MLYGLQRLRQVATALRHVPDSSFSRLESSSRFDTETERSSSRFDTESSTADLFSEKSSTNGFSSGIASDLSSERSFSDAIGSEVPSDELVTENFSNGVGSALSSESCGFALESPVSHSLVDIADPDIEIKSEIESEVIEKAKTEKKVIGIIPRSRLTLSPAYMRDFRCIGQECEDSCCLGWQVNIDHDTYQKYKNSKDEVLAPMFKAYIKRVRRGNKKNAKSNDYAHIKGASVRCEFLSCKSLCMIQERLGEDYLSNTCHDYPRIINKVDRFVERSLTLSCPEAARKVLLNPELMSFDQSEEPADSRGMIFNTVSTNNKNNQLGEFWLVREFLISLLQNRNYTIEMRLILMGKFTEFMEEYKSREDFVNMVRSFHEQVESLNLVEVMSDLPTNYDFQARLAIEILEERMQMKGLSRRYLDILAPVLQGIKYGFSAEVIAENFKKTIKEKYQPFMAQHSYLLENYFVNAVFKDLFPFRGRRFMDEYCRLMAIYSVVRLHLIGLSAMDELNLDNVVYVFQTIARQIDHNATFVNKIVNKIREAGFLSTAHLAKLINN